MQKAFAAVFDLSFKRFVTPQLASFIFVLAIVLAGITAVFMLRAPFGFIVAPLVFVGLVVFSRTAIELVLAVFQIARYAAEIARRGRPADATEGNADEMTTE